MSAIYKTFIRCKFEDSPSNQSLSLQLLKDGETNECFVLPRIIMGDQILLLNKIKITADDCKNMVDVFSTFCQNALQEMKKSM